MAHMLSHVQSRCRPLCRFQRRAIWPKTALPYFDRRHAPLVLLYHRYRRWVRQDPKSLHRDCPVALPVLVSLPHCTLKGSEFD